MKRTNAILVLAMMAVVAIWALPGCKSPSSDAIDNDLLTREQVVDLDDEYGGYNFGNEREAFSDPSLAVDYGPESSVAYDDPMDDDPEVRDIMDRPHRRRYLMITWGNLRADTSISFSTDWSGGLSVENGIVLLKRTILFDPHDEILPRTSRDLLEWKSFTRPHFDGIVVALHKRVRCDSLPNDSTAVGVRDTIRCDTPPLSVTFKTGPLTVTITEDDLEDLHRVIEVDDAGNAVAFNTIVIEPQACAGGFLAGQWKNVSDRPGGIFRGKWISHNGVHMGYLRGAYGTNSRDQKVFFGKWIAAGGDFQGLLRGRYGDFEGDRPGGWFAGEWLTRNLRVGGGLRGVWGTSDCVDGGGFFRGRWKQHCR